MARYRLDAKDLGWTCEENQVVEATILNRACSLYMSFAYVKVKLE